MQQVGGGRAGVGATGGVWACGRQVYKRDGTGTLASTKGVVGWKVERVGGRTETNLPPSPITKAGGIFSTCQARSLDTFVTRSLGSAMICARDNKREMDSLDWFTTMCFVVTSDLVV